MWIFRKFKGKICNKYIVCYENKMIGDMGINMKSKSRQPGGGRKKSKPDYDKNVILRQQMEQVEIMTVGSDPNVVNLPST